MWAERKLKGGAVSFTWVSFTGCYLPTLTSRTILGFISQSFLALWFQIFWLCSAWSIGPDVKLLYIRQACVRTGIHNHQYHFGTLNFQSMVYQKNASRWFTTLCDVSASCSTSGGKGRLSYFQIFLQCRSCLIQMLSPPKTPFVLSALGFKLLDSCVSSTVIISQLAAMVAPVCTI